MPELTEQRPIKHLGIYRSVLGDNGISRSVTIREARLDGAALRTLYRKDRSHGCKEGLPEGALANYIGKKMTDEMWVACLKRLHEWKMIDFIASYHGDVVRVALTPSGYGWAMELCGLRQRAGLPLDGVEEVNAVGE
jgi:hypothetical protein